MYLYNNLEMAKDKVQFSVNVKPNSKENNIVDVDEKEKLVTLQIAAPPSGGEANAELVKFLAATLGVRKSDIDLVRGTKSRDKVIAVVPGNHKISTLTACLERLKAAVPK